MGASIQKLSSIELFAGAGGLALGISKAGFNHLAIVERSPEACATIRENESHPLVNGWPLHECDVRNFDYSQYSGKLDLLAGGPPCQPFSLGGKHQGSNDHRDMFPETIRAVRETAPRAVLVENVKGLLRESFSSYFEYIILQLTHPELAIRDNEDWSAHLSRLEKYHTKGSRSGLSYNVVFRLVNAADYGVPQKRERVVIVGIRNDLGIEWNFPEPTHSQESLAWSQLITGEYWKKHRVPKNKRPEISPRQVGFRKRLEGQLFPPDKQPWLTVREALAGLPDPREVGATDVSNHVFYGGARAYAGHTGSVLDQPAKTLKAGDHGVPGGENMLVSESGELRYFSVRESARLQNFPDDYQFSGSWTKAMKQLGNAVPVSLAEVMARQLNSVLQTSNE